MSIAAILSDPMLKAVLVLDNEEREITLEERDALMAFIEAENERVDPAAPPTDDAAETKADAEPAKAAAAKSKATKS